MTERLTDMVKNNWERKTQRQEARIFKLRKKGQLDVESEYEIQAQNERKNQKMTDSYRKEKEIQFEKRKEIQRNNIEMKAE